MSEKIDRVGGASSVTPAAKAAAPAHGAHDGEDAPSFIQMLRSATGGAAVQQNGGQADDKSMASDGESVSPGAEEIEDSNKSKNEAENIVLPVAEQLLVVLTPPVLFVPDAPVVESGESVEKGGAAPTILPGSPAAVLPNVGNLPPPAFDDSEIVTPVAGSQEADQLSDRVSETDTSPLSLLPNDIPIEAPQATTIEAPKPGSESVRVQSRSPDLGLEAVVESNISTGGDVLENRPVGEQNGQIIDGQNIGGQITDGQIAGGQVTGEPIARLAANRPAGTLPRPQSAEGSRTPDSQPVVAVSPSVDPRSSDGAFAGLGGDDGKRGEDHSRPEAVPDIRSVEAGAATASQVFKPFVVEHAVQGSELPQVPSPETPMPNDLIDQIVRHVELRTAEGRTEMTVHLEPPDLGEVHMRLATDGFNLSAELAARNDAVRTFVQAHIADVRQALADAGIEVARFAVAAGPDFDLGRHDGQQTGRQQQRAAPVVEAASLDSLDSEVPLPDTGFDRFA